MNRPGRSRLILVASLIAFAVLTSGIALISGWGGPAAPTNNDTHKKN
jgi:hypothetical protein